MKRLSLAVLAMAMAMMACGVDKADPYRDGFPHSDTVKLDLPGGSQALTGDTQRRDGLEGDPSSFYGFTRGVTVMVNGGTAFVLHLVEDIVRNPATTVGTNSAVWGPYTNALSPNTYRFTVTQNAPNDHDYVLEGKDKNAADDAYVVILSGHHLTTGPRMGSGEFLIDWDAAATLPEHGQDVGSAQISYSRLSASDDVTVNASFHDVMDKDSGQRVNAEYRYLEQPGNGGSFDFQMNKDIVPGPSLEAATVRSRWLQTGAGRSDAKVQGGDLATPATASECWDSNFKSAFITTSFDPNTAWGAESSCAFSTADYAAL